MSRRLESHATAIAPVRLDTARAVQQFPLLHSPDLSRGAGPVCSSGPSWVHRLPQTSKAPLRAAGWVEVPRKSGGNSLLSRKNYNTVRSHFAALRRKSTHLRLRKDVVARK